MRPSKGTTALRDIQGLGRRPMVYLTDVNGGDATGQIVPGLGEEATALGDIEGGLPAANGISHGCYWERCYWRIVSRTQDSFRPTKAGRSLRNAAHA